MPNMTCDPVLFKHHTLFRLQCRGDPGGEDQLRHMIDEDRNEYHAGDGGREKRRGERRAEREPFMSARKQERDAVRPRAFAQPVDRQRDAAGHPRQERRSETTAGASEKWSDEAMSTSLKNTNN